MIQIESMQDVLAQNFNGLHHDKENVHIQGRKLSREQNCHNLEIYLTTQCRNPSLGSRPRQGGCKVAGL